MPTTLPMNGRVARVRARRHPLIYAAIRPSVSTGTSVLPWIMDLQPIGPTRHYVIACHDGGRIDVAAESMWSAGSSLGVLGPPWT